MDVCMYDVFFMHTCMLLIIEDGICCMAPGVDPGILKGGAPIMKSDN